MSDEQMTKTINVNGNSFHVEIAGTGMPLVLIMGLGAPGEKWNKNIKVYRDYFRCISLDNRGAGRSSKPKAEAYSTSDMAEDVVGIMNALGLEKAHVSGVSMGGAIAQKLAIAYPSRVRSLILTSTYASVSTSFRWAIETLRDSVDQLNSVIFKRLNQWMTFSQTFLNTRGAEVVEVGRQDAAYPWPMPTYAYKAQCNACLSHDTTRRLKEITSPTLVAAGDSDLFMTMEKTMELCAGIPNSSLYLCKNGGHVHQWEKLDEYNKVTLDFLRKHDG